MITVAQRKQALAQLHRLRCRGDEDATAEIRKRLLEFDSGREPRADEFECWPFSQDDYEPDEPVVTGNGRITR